MKPLIHFEDGLNRPDVFRITRAQVNAARRRTPAAAALLRFSFGNDFEPWTAGCRAHKAW
ncbi:MAG: hypothetical protein IPK29_09970 [Betaproteobacteria bacterium]|nr:hypothetical protein [Betaproteobacteria bacterium]